MDANHPLKKWRDTHGIGLDELAGRCGTSKASLSRIESRKQMPSMALIEKLKGETGLSADDFCRPLVGMQT